jgi:hypothetical protein
MKYALKIYHNSYFLDEKEVFRAGPYPTVDEATEKAKEIIRNSMMRFIKTGRKPHDLYTMWSIYGENPVICTIPGDNTIPGFNPGEYAYEAAEELAVKPRKRA